MEQLHFYEKGPDKKRKAEVLKPHITYHESYGFSTDKQVEFWLLQHRLMNEFLSRKNLVNQFNDFQNKEFLTNNDCRNWMKKWNVENKDLTSYIKRP